MKLYSDAELAQILDKDIFHLISDVADTLGVECYVVGGYVRDIFLERPSHDIDVVVVGSGIMVAKALKEKMGKGAHLSVFRNFGTAQVKYHDMEVEFVGARKESYRRDSRKPIVEDGTLEDDQNRRDFTINAMAQQRPLRRTRRPLLRTRRPCRRLYPHPSRPRHHFLRRPLADASLRAFRYPTGLLYR